MKAFLSLTFFLHVPWFNVVFTQDKLQENRRTCSGNSDYCKWREPVFEFRRLLLLTARTFPLAECRSVYLNLFTSWKPHSQVGAHDLTKAKANSVDVLQRDG